jgi:hypothetical protein
MASLSKEIIFAGLNRAFWSEITSLTSHPENTTSVAGDSEAVGRNRGGLRETQLLGRKEYKKDSPVDFGECEDDLP